jgi:hypothetical protein
VKGKRGLGAAASEVTVGKRPQRLCVERDEVDAFGYGEKFAIHRGDAHQHRRAVHRFTAPADKMIVSVGT